MKEIKAPATFSDAPAPKIFLGGSIEMGAAENWQERLRDLLSAIPGTILNPRRNDWDSSWKQDITNGQFCEQVEWELKAQETSDLNIYYFSPGTQSPITLLELGLFAKSRSTIVCCPEGFWRKGNIDIVSRRYAIPQADNFVALTSMLLESKCF